MASGGVSWMKKPKGANLYAVSKDGKVLGDHQGVNAGDLVPSSGGGTSDPGAGTDRDVAGTYEGKPVRWGGYPARATAEQERELLASASAQAKEGTIAQRQRVVSFLDEGLKPSGYEWPSGKVGVGARTPTLQRSVAVSPGDRSATVTRKTAQRLRDAFAEALPRVLRPKPPSIF